MKKLSMLANGVAVTLVAGWLAGSLTGTAFAQDPQTAPPAIGRQAKPNKAPRNLDKAFRRMDANKDGKLSREEWKGKAQGFERLDSNQDGFVTREELEAVRQQMNKALNKMDANNDGQIARDEWKGKARGFDKLDANSDGVLTTEELKKRHHGKRNGTLQTGAPANPAV